MSETDNYGADQHPATFVGGTIGVWRVESMVSVVGESLPSVERVAIYREAPHSSGAWTFVVSRGTPAASSAARKERSM